LCFVKAIINDNDKYDIVLRIMICINIELMIMISDDIVLIDL